MTATTIDDIQHPLLDTTVTPGRYRYMLTIAYNGGERTGTGFVTVTTDTLLADVVAAQIQPVFRSCAVLPQPGDVRPQEFAMIPTAVPA